MNSSKSNDNTPQWLAWAREIQSMAQTGNHYAENEYNRERYQRLSEISAEIISQHSDLPYERLVGAFKAQIGYATPRVDVRGAVFRNGELLLVREVMDGGWTMPGGWADVGETPSSAVEREVWEEAGFRVKARKLVGVYDANRVNPLEVFHAYKLVFLCDLVSGAAKPSSETSEVAFFSQAAIPTDLSGERTKPRHIQDAFDHLADPHLETVFE